MNLLKYDVVIIGAGASGTYLSMFLDTSFKTLVIDKNGNILKKFLLTGAGSANITNTCSQDILLANMIYGTKNFMYSAFKNNPSQMIMDIVNKNGFEYEYKGGTKVHLLVKNEEVRDTFKQQLLKKPNLSYLFNTSVIDIHKNENGHYLIDTDKKTRILTPIVVIATGGLSYSKFTGCTGDGYKLAESLNHTIKPLFPMGTQIELKEFNKPFIDNLATAIPSCLGRFYLNKKLLVTEQNDLMITHRGVGGPLMRRLSGYIHYNNLNQQDFYVELDLIESKQDFINNLNKFKRCYEIWKTYPKFTKKFISNFYKQLNLEPESDLQNINKNKKDEIINFFFNLRLNINNTHKFVQRDFEGAINTGGGINTKEIDPNTFMSKIHNNLYFVGEVMDVNAKSGGFNLTVCFASAYMCSLAINNSFEK